MRLAFAAPGLALLAILWVAPAAEGASSPKAVEVARATRIPACSVFVDAAATPPGKGTRTEPFASLAAAVDAAAAGAVICVAEGVYRVELSPGAKPLTLAGGFRRGSAFRTRDSARFVSRAEGSGSGSFVAIADPAPTGNALTAVDGFEITGYARAVVREYWEPQRFELTNNFIHHNRCTVDGVAGAGFALSNVRGRIEGNVLADNACWRGGAGFMDDSVNKAVVTIARNRIERNTSLEPDTAHGGGLYLFGRRLTITANHFEDNRTSGWGGGLYVGAFTGGGQTTRAVLSWNRYEGNVAGIGGGGFFCDDSAECRSDHDIFLANCGGNVYVDSGPVDDPTVVAFDHMTNVGALDADCSKPGPGIRIDSVSGARDSVDVVNALFWGNAAGADFAASCDGDCSGVRITARWSMVDRRTPPGGPKPVFGPGILAPRDPRFVSLARGDLHLKSRFGHYTPAGPVVDATSSPALAKGDPASPVPRNPARAGRRTELGAYGNSPEASFVR